MRNTNGLGGKSTQKEIHTHIQTRGHYLYLYLYLLNQQSDLDSGQKWAWLIRQVMLNQAHVVCFRLIFIDNAIGVLS